jgi:hypothetical protein
LEAFVDNGADVHAIALPAIRDDLVVGNSPFPR